MFIGVCVWMVVLYVDTYQQPGRLGESARGVEWFFRIGIVLTGFAGLGAVLGWLVAQLIGKRSPGWWPDSNGQPVLRFWDGHAWTDELVDMPAPDAFDIPVPSRRGDAPVFVRTNGHATASLVLALFYLVPLVPSVLAIAFGHLAFSEIRRSAGAERGRRTAIAGLVIGYLGIAFGMYFVYGMVFEGCFGNC
jgi:hypothetical protein